MISNIKGFNIGFFLKVFIIIVFFFVILLAKFLFDKSFFTYQFPVISTESFGGELDYKYLTDLDNCTFSERDLDGLPCFYNKIKYSYFNDPNFDIKKLYLKLSSLIYEGQLTTRLCHYLSHQLGDVYLKKMTLNQALEINLVNSNINDMCFAGYYHGLFISEGKNSKNYDGLMSQVARNIDIDYDKSTYTPQQKYRIQTSMHGLGHGVYAKYGDINVSNNYCKNIFKTPKAIESCIAGVFMQDFIETYDVGLDKPIDYCDKFKDTFQECLIGSRRPEDVVEKIKGGLASYCDGLKKDEDSFICYTTLFSQEKISGNIIDIKKSEICNESKNKKIICDYAYFTTIKYIDNLVLAEGDFKYDEYKLAKKICLNLGPIDYLRCRKKLNENKYLEIMVPVHPQDVALPPLDIRSLIYFFK